MIPIIVLTPTRNERWIIDRFLAVTSRFADGILIADQQSTDGTREICTACEKVRLIDNPNGAFNEGERQLLLLEKARALWPGPKLLVALDADEILAADAMNTDDWRSLRSVPMDTAIFFEKPDLMPGLRTCVLYPTPHHFALADDGKMEHTPQQIHSRRLPLRPDSPRLSLKQVNILHYGLVRVEAQMAKVRFYAVQENLLGTNPLRRRRAFYGGFRQRQYVEAARAAVPVQESWFAGWEEAGIDLRTFEEPTLPWQTTAVLQAMATHGERRFWLDPIWDCDWEAARQEALKQGIAGIPSKPIVVPPWTSRILANCIDLMSGVARSPLVGRLRRAIASRPPSTRS